MKPHSPLPFPTPHRDVSIEPARDAHSLKTDSFFRPPTDYTGRCSGPSSPSFRRISKEYFQKESRRDFAREATLFSVIVFTAAIPVIEGVRGLFEIAQRLL